MRGLLNRRCGLVDEEDKEDVRSRMVALLEARGDKLPLGLAADLGLMFRYLAGSPEQRRDLLAGGLFVRCAAALLCGSYTGVLEVDAGATGGCEVNSITRSLLINIGQTEMNLAGGPAAEALKFLQAAHMAVCDTCTRMRFSSLASVMLILRVACSSFQSSLPRRRIVAHRNLSALFPHPLTFCLALPWSLCFLMPGRCRGGAGTAAAGERG